MSGNIIIQNAGELPIWGMRLLGLSNKNELQIGKFGTGLKESIALLARMGVEPIIFSGTCRIDFSTQSIDGQQELCFMLSERRDRFAENEWHGLGLHPNFGKSDWADPWMVFRELICNAIDESGIDSLYHDITYEEPSGKENATRVFLPANENLVKAYGTIENKILDLGKYETISDSIDGRVLAKRDDKPLQIYHRGVWVDQDRGDNKVSLFDYDLPTIDLNESRSADWFDVNWTMRKLICRFGEAQAERLLISVIKRNKSDELPYEATQLHECGHHLVSSDKEQWQKTFFKVFGENAVVTDTDKFFYDRLQSAGKVAVIIEHSGMREFLRKAGVPIAADVLSVNEIKYDRVEEPSEQNQIEFDKVWAMIESLELDAGKDKPPLKIFYPRMGSNTIVFGEYRDGVCFINGDIIGSRQGRVAMIEEIGHHVSGFSDCSRDFQHWIFDALDRSMFNKEKANG